MKKKLFSAIILALCLISAGLFVNTNADLTLTAGAYGEKKYGDFTYKFYYNKLYINDYPEDATGEVIIPSEIDGCAVECINSFAFRDCKKITSVKIPDSVTLIEGFAFADCVSLTTVSIGENVTTIGKYAFAGCTSLTDVDFGKNPSISQLNDAIFSGCSSLEEFYVPKSITALSYGTFLNCTSLKTVVFHSNVTSIGDTAFKGCTALEEISIPYGVTTVGHNEFENCTALKTVSIPSTVTSIDKEAFKDCTGLKNITIPDSVETIAYDAFRNCTELVSITVPDSVTDIERGMCWGCTSLETVSIGKNVNTVGDWAFSGCTALKKVTFSKNAAVTSIGAQCFSNCSSLVSFDVPDSLTSMGDCSFANCTSLQKFNYTENVSLQNVGNQSFKNCTSLEYITLPATLTRIGSEAFKDCSSLVEFKIPDGITGVPFALFSGCTALTSVYIPEGVESIAEHAFSGCKSMEAIKLPESCLNVWGYAFFGCESLTSVTFGKQLEEIGESAFSCCGALTTIKLPDTVKKIGQGAFSLCRALSSIDLGKSLTCIKREAFEGCTALKYIVIPASVTQFDCHVFKDCNLTIEFRCDPPFYYDDVFRYTTALILYPCDNTEWGTDTTEWLIGDLTFAEKHTMTYIDGKAATCTEAGNNAYCLCSACGKAFVDSEGKTETTVSAQVIEAKGHDMVNVAAKAATYASAGNKAYSKCTVCRKLFTDSKGTAETTLAAVTIPKLVEPYAIAYLDYIGNVTLSSTAFTYNNTAKKPTVMVKNTSGKAITKGTSYTVKYCCSAGCKTVGTHKVTITGKGNYTGSITKTFKINKQTLVSSRITLSAASYTYNTAVKKPTVTVKSSQGTTLTNGGSYTVTYCCSAGCKTVGIHKVTINGKGNYVGTVTKTFTINKQQIISARVNLSDTSFTYNGAVKKPTVTVKTIQGTTLTNGSSYTVAYCCSAGCKTAGTHKVTITGKGNYTGTAVKTFTIKKDLTAGTATLSCISYTYNASVKKTTVTVKNSEGTAITNGTSYTVSYCCSGGCKTPGTHTVTITGMGNYAGTIKKTFTINKQQIISARVILSATSFTYDGNVKKPTVTVKTIQGTTLTNGSSYKVTYCCSGGCKTKGTHKVTVTAIGSNYTGTVTKTFTIK